MAMLASKSSLPSGMASSSAASQLQAARDYASAPGSRRTPLSDTSNHGTFASPTESEFSEAFESGDSVKSWDEKQVCEWLKNNGFAAYTGIFKENNVNGSNLIECDQAVLKEMGIKKIGDRVRIFVGIKDLRNKAIPNQKKRNRDSIATLDRLTANMLQGANQGRLGANPKRYSTQFSGSGASNFSPSFPYPSPKPESRAGQNNYFAGRRSETPSELSKNGLHSKRGGDPTILNMPSNKEVIRVIHNGLTKMLDVTGWKTFEDVMTTTLRKMVRPDANLRNYCFYVHDPSPENPDKCRKLSEKDLLDILSNSSNPLRGRLILRTIHSGEPSAAEIEKAHDLAMDELKNEHQAAYRQNSEGNIRKLEKMLGERQDNLRAPLSPAVVGGMSKHTPLVGDQRRQMLPATKMLAPAQLKNGAAELDAWSPPKRVDSKRQQSIRKFEGARPPSELISHDLSSYFTDHKAKDLQRTVSMAQRRSARVSKALSRLSVASNFSIKDVLKDAPALPSIPTNFLEHDPYANSGGTSGRSARPLSVWRQSVASVLPSVREDESNNINNNNEPDRKSYISFNSGSEDGTSRPGTLTTLPTDETGSTSTFMDEGTTSSSGTGGHSTLNEQYREALKADGEGPDEELDAFLTGNTFDKFSWMQGDLIGQGSFGSVYLALHAVTGELMAVKQVELPGKAGADAALEKRKESMLAALKREINLLSELQHEHIVQYLGVQATDEHLNIFLEYVPGGSVASMLNNYGQLREPLIRTLVRQILDGLNYLHKRDIIHRDIKGANILVDNKGKVKISDFGISKKVDLQSASGGAGGGSGGAPGNKRVSMQGSVFWMAPEVVKQTSYTRKADIWSMGALIVEMFTGEHPFPKLSQIQAIFQLGTMKKPEVPANTSQDAKDFLEKTFEIDEKARPEAEELMKLPFLKPLVA